MLFIDKNLEFEMLKERRILIIEIKFVGIDNKLVSELFGDDLLDIRLVETVFE